MASALPQNTGLQLGRQARERFVADMIGVMPQVAKQVMERVQNLFEQATSSREMQDRRDAMQQYQKCYRAWMDGTVKAWQRALQPPTATARVRLESAAFELIGEEVVENKILSSRIAMAIAEKVTGLNDLRLRIQSLENTAEMASHDILRPEVVAQLLVEQWTTAGLSRELWLQVQDTVQQQLVERSISAYQRTNEFLIERGVLPEIDFKSLVRRTASASGSGGGGGGGGGGADSARPPGAAPRAPGGHHEPQGGPGYGGGGGEGHGYGGGGGGEAGGGRPQRPGRPGAYGPAAGPGAPGAPGGQSAYGGASQSAYAGPGGQSAYGGPAGGSQGSSSRMAGTFKDNCSAWRTLTSPW